MSLTVVYPQWRDQQRHDRSPFSDRVDVPDGLDEIFVDAALYCYGATGPLWLSAIAVTDEAVTVEVTDGTATAAGSIRRGSLEDVIRLYGAGNRPAGVLVGAQAGIPPLFALHHARATYTRRQTEFAAGVIMPMPSAGVVSLAAGDGEPLGGLVTLVGDHGVELDLDADGRVRVNVRGVPLPGARDGLRTINRFGPNPRGDFKFTPSTLLASDSALRIEGGANSITISVIGG